MATLSANVGDEAVVLVSSVNDGSAIMPVNDPVGAVVYGMDTSNVDSGPGCIAEQSHHLAHLPRS